MRETTQPPTIGLGSPVTPDQVQMLRWLSGASWCGESAEPLPCCAESDDAPAAGNDRDRPAREASPPSPRCRRPAPSDAKPSHHARAIVGGKLHQLAPAVHEEPAAWCDDQWARWCRRAGAAALAHVMSPVKVLEAVAAKVAPCVSWLGG